MKKIVSVVLCLILLLSVMAVTVSAVPATSFWYNGDIMTPYANNHAFMTTDGPFSYAFYYEGTDPYDTRAAGFYPMVKANNMDSWSHGYYMCGLDETEKREADDSNANRILAIHQACTHSCNYHYSPGYCFTAPFAGTVEFTYQFAKAYGGAGCDNHMIKVMRDVEDPYNNGILYSFAPTAVLYGEGANASGEPETQVLTIEVTEGEKIYFVVDNVDGNGGMSSHWIKSAKYIAGEIPEVEETEPVEETTGNADVTVPKDDSDIFGSDTDDVQNSGNQTEPQKKLDPKILWFGIGFVAGIGVSVVTTVIVVAVRKKRKK